MKFHALADLALVGPGERMPPSPWGETMGNARSLGPTGNTAAATLEDELLLLLAKQSSRVPVAVLFAAGIIVALAADYLPIQIWGSWFAAVAFMSLVRLVLLSRLPAMLLPTGTKLRIAVALSAVNGVVHGSSLYFFAYMPEAERAFQTVILSALTTGAVATTGGYRPLFLNYSLGAFFPLVPLWAISPGLPGMVGRHVALAVLILMFGLLLTGLARNAYQVFRESFEMRAQKDRLNRQLASALAEAESANRAKTRFLASASHDLRQPIHTLSLFSAALSMQELNSETRAIADHINVALENLASQLDALLDISKLDAGVMEMNVTVLDLHQMLIRLVEEFRPLCDDKGLLIAYLAPAGLAQVETDPALLERIIRNLLSNAVKYTDTGSISLEIERRRAGIYLRIGDTGRGIPAAEHDHVFEEFYQLDNPERDRRKGLGLGLSIVKRLAAMLDIEMTMQSSLGQGTQFELKLRPAGTAAPQPEFREPREPAQVGMHVLVIDDEAEVRAGMETLLSAMGHQVTLADSTEHALAHVRSAPPELVLADLRLRGADNGIEAIRAVRALAPHVHALLISGDTAPARLKEAQQAGIRLLHKPVAVHELRRAIHEVCELNP